MAVKVSKPQLLSLKGNGKIEINGIVLKKTAEMKDLDLIVTSILSWRNNKKGHEIKIIQIICYTFCNL